VYGSGAGLTKRDSLARSYGKRAARTHTTTMMTAFDSSTTSVPRLSQGLDAWSVQRSVQRSIQLSVGVRVRQCRSAWIGGDRATEISDPKGRLCFSGRSPIRCRPLDRLRESNRPDCRIETSTFFTSLAAHMSRSHARQSGEAQLQIAIYPVRRLGEYVALLPCLSFISST
jgi:hypothetical protein